jgi:hypothetical protein
MPDRLHGASYVWHCAMTCRCGLTVPEVEGDFYDEGEAVDAAWERAALPCG